jgi:hypothetical protein
VLYNDCGYGENKAKTDLLIAGDWGDKAGEFGIYEGDKIPEKYGVLDLIITKEEIYILDALNSRIQVFDLDGKFKKIIKFAKKWEGFGLAWGFTLYKNNFYMLIGIAPSYYSTRGFQEIHQFSYDGKFIKKFGKAYLQGHKKHPDTEFSYYYNILSDANKGYLVCRSSYEMLAFDAQGNMKYNILDIIGKKSFAYSLRGIDSYGNLVINKFRRHTDDENTIIYDVNTRTIKSEVSGRFDHVDNKGNFYLIRTYRPKRDNPDLVTEITKYDSKTKTTSKLEISGDVKIIKSGKEKLFHYRSNYSVTEISKVDPEGNIYHLIALEDGVLLRKITLK